MTTFYQVEKEAYINTTSDYRACPNYLEWLDALLRQLAFDVLDGNVWI